MATFTMSITGSSVVNGTKNWTISDADVQRLSDYLVFRFSQVTPLTPAQALLAWSQDFVTRTSLDVRGYIREQAAIPPLTFT